MHENKSVLKNFKNQSPFWLNISIVFKNFSAYVVKTELRAGVVLHYSEHFDI